MGTTSHDFSGETVIVTGGGSGIGRGIARRFGEAGATVIVADVQSEPKDLDAEVPTHERIREDGGTAEYVHTDVTDPDDVEAVVEAAREFGGVDVMVNNAGIVIGGPFEEVSPEDLRRIHEVNVYGVFYGTQAAARDMEDRGAGGSIVNTASISSTYATPNLVQYESTKGAVRMITRGAAVTLAPEIRVNAVAPGKIATEFAEGLTERQEQNAREDGFIKPVPLQRAGYPEDVAAAAVWLASEDASYTTGELLYVDGGWQAL